MTHDLIAAAAVGIVSVDAGAQILSANAAASALLGCAAADLVGRGAHEAFNGDRPEDECELEAAVRAGRSMQYEDDTFVRGDGALLPVWWAVNPLREPGTGTLLGAVLVFGDSTAKRAQAVADAAERAQRRAELAEAQRSIAELEWAAGVTQALSSTLDEVEVMRRLVRLVADRLGDLAVADLASEDAVFRRVASAVAEGVDVDLATLLRREDIAAEFEPESATYRTVTSSEVVEITREQMSDPALLSGPTRAMLEAVGATHALAIPLIARGRVVGGLGLIRVGDS
ncbi:MAG: PAS domain S-box protein, partial [Jatrophihabitantaceae bacterium]